MNCTTCNIEARRFGKDRKGNQRFQCLTCKKTFSEPKEKPLGNMTLAMEKVLLIMRLLVEGNSIRSTERITSVDKKTILALLLVVGEKCERLMEEKIQKVSVKQVQCDEIWGFVAKKEATKKRQGLGDDNHLGDAYCFVGMDKDTKLILAWHLGRRTVVDTVAFTEKLDRATADHSFEVYTDGFTPYRDAIVYSLGGKKVNFAQVVKVFGKPQDEDHRYSPPQVIGLEKTAIFGNPDLDNATTSHIERQNLTIRMGMRRMTRLTNAFSKKWLNLNAAYALHYAYYNFCRVHMSLRITPMMEAGLTDHVWSLKELLTA
jgi:transposase-like protein/IS1 family transposase